MPWFFFGTLLDPDVLRLVLGRELPPERRRPATLWGFRRVVVRGESYPALRAEPGARVDGMLVEGLSADQRRRVLYFEGEEFTPQPQTVVCAGETLSALVFVATDATPLDRRDWRLANWQRDHKTDFLPMARDWMTSLDTADTAAAERRWQTALSRLQDK